MNEPNIEKEMPLLGVLTAACINHVRQGRGTLEDGLNEIAEELKQGLQFAPEASHWAIHDALEAIEVHRIWILNGG